MFFVGFIIDTIVRPVGLLLYDFITGLWLNLPEVGHRNVAYSSLMLEITLGLFEPLELFKLFFLVLLPSTLLRRIAIF